MKSFKYINNISEGEATMLLYNQIGTTIDENGDLVYGISGEMFANEMRYLQDKCKKIKVRINSIGGSVLEGYSIISSILSSQVPVETYIDGLGASIAGVIAVSGSKCYMMDYGTLMLHNPMGGNNDKALEVVKNSIIKIFVNRCKMSEENVYKMMEEETWLDSESALAMGMIDEIVNTNKKIEKDKNLYNLYKIYNQITINEKPKEMKSVSEKLGLAEDATEQDIINKIDEIKNSVELANQEKENTQKELDELKNSIKEKEEQANFAKAEEMVNSYSLDKEEKEKAIKLALVDFDGVKNLLEKTKATKSAKVFDIKNIEKSNDDRSDWTMRDWEKKDPKGLKEMLNSNPEEFNRLYKQQYNIK